MNLQNKTILVIGASGGIGSAIVSSLQAKEARVIAHYHDKPLDSSDVQSMKADLKNNDEIKSMFDELAKQNIKLDGFVYTPAIEVQSDDPLNTSRWHETFQVNLFAASECARHAKPLMNNNGSMVFVGSIAAEPQIGFAFGSLAYTLTKASIHHLVRQLAAAWAPSVRVNAVVPGYTMTSMWDGFSEEGKQQCEQAMAIKRFIKPEEIAHSVIYLLENGAITGQRLVVDGGLGIKQLI